jgi:hypothetical protein
MLFLCLALPACDGAAAPKPPPSSGTPTSSPTSPAEARFALVGHEPLFGRGMNAGLAVGPRYAYIGNRTDGSAGHPHPGVLVVDVQDPAKPRIVGEITPPPAGTSSRELRIWPDQDLLVVLDLPCGSSTHYCSGSGSSSLRFYDVRGDRARAPRLIRELATAYAAHEMFLWVDPARPGRALLYVSTDTPGDGRIGLFVLDISRARAGGVATIAEWSGNRLLGGKLHSVGVSADGTRTYLAHLGGGFAVLDSSDLAHGRPNPGVELVTAPEAALRWSPGPHSAIEVPGSSPRVLTTDEVYGGAGSCPWGWMRLIDVTDPRRPRLIGELRTERNRVQACTGAPPSSAYSFSSHNPTVVGDVALASWHGAGLVAAAVGDAGLEALATFVPEPLAGVATEDPRLTSGPVKVAMWSTPVVSGGLIYVVDLRNGLYVLRYEGPGADALMRTVFREGNSNRTG